MTKIWFAAFNTFGYMQILENNCDQNWINEDKKYSWVIV